MTKETKFWQEMAMHHRWRLQKLQKGTTPKGLKIKVTPKVALPKQLQNKWQDTIICEKQFIKILEEFHEDQLKVASFNIKKSFHKFLYGSKLNTGLECRSVD